MLPFAVAFLAAVPAGGAEPVVPCDRLLAPRPAQTHRLDVGYGFAASVVDRYGGYVARYRHGAKQFTLRLTENGRAVARERRDELVTVAETLDGQPTRNPFYVRRLADGPHEFAFAITPIATGRSVAMLRVPFTVGSCDTASAFAALGGDGRGLGAVLSSGANERGGNPGFTAFRLAPARGSAVRTRLPASARGRAVGRIRVVTAGGGRFTAALRTPVAFARGATGITLLRRGSLRVTLLRKRRSFLSVSGAPADTLSVGVALTGPGRSLVTGSPATPLRVVEMAGGGSAVSFDAARLCSRCSA